MEIADKILHAVRAGVEELYGQSVGEGVLQLQATRPEFEGQLTLVVFPLLRISRKKPEDTAREIGEYLVGKVPEVVAGYNAINGFLNLSIATSQWISLLQEIRQNPTYGFVPVTEESPLVMIEYSSPNTNKPLHLGHVRNNLLG